MALPIMDPEAMIRALSSIASRKVDSTFGEVTRGITRTLESTTDRITRRITESEKESRIESERNRNPDQAGEAKDVLDRFYRDRDGFLESIDENIGNLVELLGGEVKRRRFHDQDVNRTESEGPDLPNPLEEEIPRLGFHDLLPLGLGAAIASSVASYIPVALAALVSTGTIAAVGAGILGGKINFDIGAEIGKLLGSEDGLSSAILAVFTGVDGSILSSAGTVGTYAAAGAVIGSVVPVFGTFAGLIVGAVVGGIMTVITNLVGFDRLSMGFDRIIDHFNSTIELFFDKDEARILGRIEETQRGADNMVERLDELNAKRIELLVELETAQVNGDQREIDLIRSRLEDVTRQIERTNENREELLRQNRLLQAEYDQEQRTIMEAIDDVSLYIVQLPVRLTDRAWQLITGSGDPVLGLTVEDYNTRAFEFVSSLKDKFIGYIDRFVDWVKDIEFPEIDFSVIMDKIKAIPDLIYDALVGMVENIVQDFQDAVASKSPRLAAAMFGTETDPTQAFLDQATGGSAGLVPTMNLMETTLKNESIKRLSAIPSSTPNINSATITNNSTNVVTRPMEPVSRDRDELFLYLDGVSR